MACNIKNCNTPAICCTGNNACEKTCIEATKVFDACMQQQSINTTLNVTFSGSTSGYDTVVGVRSSGEAVISDLVITPIAGSVCSRVSYTLTVPIVVVAANSAGTQITGTSSMTFSQDIVMKVPSDGVIAPFIKATAVIVGLQNSISGNQVTTNACVTIITKVVADVILVVSAYGYPVLPPCQEYTQDVCSGVFSTPVFPR